MFLHQKENFESMREDALYFAKDRYFNGNSDNRSVPDKFDFFRSRFCGKVYPSKTNRLTSSIPRITPEIRRKIRRRNRTHAKARKTAIANLV